MGTTTRNTGSKLRKKWWRNKNYNHPQKATYNSQKATEEEHSSTIRQVFTNNQNRNWKYSGR